MSFLPGWFPAGAAAGGGPTTLEHVASSTSTGQTITAPADIQAGDLLVLLDRSSSGSNPALVLPTGFTLINEFGDGGSLRQALSAKIADGSEASAVLTGMNSTIPLLRKILVVFRPDRRAHSLIIGSADVEGTSGNPSPQTVTASAGTVPLVILGVYGSIGVVDPRTFTVGGVGAKDGEVLNQPGGSSNIALAWKIYNVEVAPADAVVDMDDEGSAHVLQSCYIEVG